MTNHLIKLSKQLSSADFFLVTVNALSLSVCLSPSISFLLSLFHLKIPAIGARSGQLTLDVIILRWMALSRGMSVGLLGGEELVL